MDSLIGQLVRYGLEKGLIGPEDEIDDEYVESGAVVKLADELDDLTQEINLKLDKLIEKAEKKNHDSSSDHDSPIQF